MPRSNMVTMVQRLVKREAPGNKNASVIVRVRLQPKEMVALGHYLAHKDIDLNKYVQAILLEAVRRHMRDRENRRAVEEIYKNFEEKGHFKLRSAKKEASKKAREDRVALEAHSEQEQNARNSVDRPTSGPLDPIDRLSESDHPKSEVESRDSTPPKRQRETLGKYAAQMGLIDPKEDEGAEERIEDDRYWAHDPAGKQSHVWSQVQAQAQAQVQAQAQAQAQRRDVSYVPRSDEIASMLNSDPMDVVKEAVRKAKLLSKDLGEGERGGEPR